MYARIQGQGLACCLGHDRDAIHQAMVDRVSGLRDWPELPGRLGSIAQESWSQIFNDLEQGGIRLSHISKAMAMQLWVALRAMQSAGWKALDADTGLILATTTGQIHRWDHLLVDYFSKSLDEAEFTRRFHHFQLGSLLEALIDYLPGEHQETKQWTAPKLLLTSACSASTQALGVAFEWLRTHRVRRVLVGTVELLCELTLRGFSSLQLLSPNSAKPFDKNRSGINLSEASAFFCLEWSSEPGIGVFGYGMSSDAFHMTAPEPEGAGSFSSMSAALKMAGIAPKDLGWVHAHGTGSQHNDIAEVRALQRLLQDSTTPVSSTKWYHGHALGASGALETQLVLKALEKDLVYANAGMEIQDDGVRLFVPREHLQRQYDFVLKNTLGFGGVNASLVIGRRQ